VKTLLLLSEMSKYEDTDMARLYRKAFELVRRAPNAADPPSAQQLTLLADLLEARPPDTTLDEDWESAERVAREILTLRRAALPSGEAPIASSLARLSDLLVAKADRLWTRADPASAAEAYREARSLVRESGPGSEHRLAEIESDLGGCLVELQRFSEAEPLLTRSLQVFQAEHGGQYGMTHVALHRLVGLYTGWGKTGEASRYQELLPAISVEKVRDVGRVRIAPRVHSRNGGQSASVGGRPVWVFQDTTTLGFDDAGRRRIDTSWGVVNPATGTDLPTVTGTTDSAGAPLDLIPWTAGEKSGTYRLQVEAVLWDGARDRALVFYTKTQQDAQERSGERRVGTSLALWSRADAPAIRPLLRPGADEPTLLFGANEPPWGSAALAIGDWLYVYGCEPVTRKLDVPCRLARVPLDRALDRAEWRFYTGSIWSADWQAAKPVMMDACPQMSVTWNAYLGKYVAVNTRILSSLLSIRTADRPEGPWSEPIFVRGLPSPAPFPWIKPAFVHPELARDGGRVQIVTYARNSVFAGNEIRAVEIEFRKR
jgi:hypothetical protein